MSKTNSLLRILFFLFLFNILFNLERVIFINEIFVVSGIIIYIFNRKFFIPYIQPKLLMIISFLLYYGIAHVIFSFFILKDNSLYTFIRTSVIWYSIFAFFLGIKFVPFFYEEQKIFKQPLNYIIVLIPSISFILIKFGELNINPPLLAIPVLVPLMLFKIKNNYKLVLIFLGLIIFQTVSATLWLLYFVYILFLVAINSKLVRSVTFNKIVALIIILIVFSLLFYMNYAFSNFYVKGFKVFNKDYDSNSMWRLMFWSEQIKDNFLKHPIFGIGFGTKLFNRKNMDTKFLLMTGGKKNKILEYVQGTHNSFIFILIRMGLLGFIPFILFNFTMIDKFFHNERYKDPLIFSFFTAFLFMTIIALFNVVLESPLYSGTYWIISGMLYQRHVDLDLELLHNKEKVLDEK